MVAGSNDGRINGKDGPSHGLVESGHPKRSGEDILGGGTSKGKETEEKNHVV